MKKKNLVLAGILALALVFAFGLTSCELLDEGCGDPDCNCTDCDGNCADTCPVNNDPGGGEDEVAWEDYLGGWTRTSGSNVFSVTFSDNRLTFTLDNTSGTNQRQYALTLTDAEVTPVTNTRTAHSDFSSGFRFVGTVETIATHSWNLWTQTGGTGAFAAKAQPVIGDKVMVFWFINDAGDRLRSGGNDGQAQSEADTGITLTYQRIQ